MVHIFEILNPSLPIHFVTYRALRRRLSHDIGQNSVYPIDPRVGHGLDPSMDWIGLDWIGSGF